MPISAADKVRDHFSKYPKRNYPKGQILVFADETPTNIFYVVEGRVRKYDTSYRGDEVIINIFKPGSFFPMSLALNHTDNKFFYKTETEVELYVIPADDAKKFLEDNPDVALDLLSRVYQGLEGMYGRMVHLMSGTAKSRLIYELLIECRRFGKQQLDGSYLLTSNEVDLAARSGLSRETISREMQKLKALGWVQHAKNTIMVTDITLLESALGSDV